MSRLEELLVSGGNSLYSAAVAIIQRSGKIEQIATTGQTARFSDDGGTVAPPELIGSVTESTIFDFASLTKLFVTTTLLTLVEEGALALDEPVATWLPSFTGGERTAVTLRNLMTHTSGLPALLSLWTDWPDRPARIDALLNCPLQHKPGTNFEYSCVGYLVAGLLAEKVTGVPLADLVRSRICEPLGLADTGYLPSPERVARTAATEYQPATGQGSGRGMVRGEVHDENSWSLGGTGGNAGIFGTARDLARFGEMLRGFGAVDGVRILSGDSVEQMTRDQLPASIDPGYRHGLGVRIGDRNFMGVLAASGAFGHTGFTGTSLVVSRQEELVVVLLTNRVHPSRDWSDIMHVRRGLAELSLLVPPNG
ncbi:MAG TPA: serine hydrolase domain-containing protein [Candidatus Limnocylindrales bacterium]